MDEKSINIKQCEGECQGSCSMCDEMGIWNRSWMCFLYKIKGMNGCYCSNCVNRISRLTGLPIKEVENGSET